MKFKEKMIIVFCFVLILMLTGCTSSLIQYELDNAEVDPQAVGTYLGEDGSLYFLFSDGTAEYYYKDYDEPMSGQKWGYFADKKILIKFDDKTFVWADAENLSVSDYYFVSDNPSVWIDERYVKLSDEVYHISGDECARIIDDFIPEYFGNDKNISEEPAASNEENQKIKAEKVTWCKYDDANKVIGRYNAFYPDEPISPDDIIADYSLGTYIRMTDDIVYHIGEMDGGNCYNCYGYTEHSEYNREVFYYYAQRLIEVSSYNEVDISQIQNTPYPENFDYISDGQHVGYTEYEEPKNIEGVDYIYDLQVDDVAYWFQ